jgi:hypothetical protein
MKKHKHHHNTYDEHDCCIIKLWKVLRVKRTTLKKIFDQMDSGETYGDHTLDGEEWMKFLQAVLFLEWEFLRPNEKWGMGFTVSTQETLKKKELKITLEDLQAFIGDSETDWEAKYKKTAKSRQAAIDRAKRAKLKAVEESEEQMEQDMIEAEKLEALEIEVSCLQSYFRDSLSPICTIIRQMKQW